MNALEALLLGVVQGLTEFLPISSSGHLILVPWLLDFRYLEENPDFNKSFDVALHVGTLIAVIIYFRHDLAELMRAGVRSARKRRIETRERAPGLADRARDRPRGGDRRRRRGLHRGRARPSLADSDPAGRFRPVAGGRGQVAAAPRHGRASAGARRSGSGSPSRWRSRPASRAPASRSPRRVRSD